MSTGRFATASVLFAACLAVQVAMAQQGRHAPRAQAAREIAAKPVDDFSFHGIGALDALLALGRQERVPLAIESVDLPFASRPVSIDVKDATVGSLLGVILAGSKGYRWSVRDGVIQVTNPLEPPARGNLLDCRIPRFRTDRVPLTEADRRLGFALIHAVFPGITGIAGDYPGYNFGHPVGPMSFRNASVRDILDALVKFPPFGAWVVLVPARYVNQHQLASSDLWKIMGYDFKDLRYLGDLVRQSLRGYATSSPPRR